VAAASKQRAHRAYAQLRTALDAAGWTERSDDGSGATSPALSANADGRK